MALFGKRGRGISSFLTPAIHSNDVIAPRIESCRRVTPIIRELISHGDEITIAVCHFIFFQDYLAPYSSTRFFLPKFALSIKVRLDLSEDVEKARKYTGFPNMPETRDIFY